MRGDAPPDRRRARGQSYVLEGLVAGVVVLLAVVVALQSTAVTPLSAAATSQRLEEVDRSTADTMLDHAARNGSLREAVLYWDPARRTFANGSTEGYVPGPPPNRFGKLLNRTLYEERIAVNVYVSFTDTAGETDRRTMVYQGSPSDAAVSASRAVVIHDGDSLAGPYDDRTLNATDATTRFYAPDRAPESPVYNVVEVRVIVWRI